MPAAVRLHSVLAGLFALSIGALPNSALGQVVESGRRPEAGRHRFVSVDIDPIEATVIQIDLPDDLEFTPTHPADVDAVRPPRSQPTPLAGRHWHMGIRLGATVRPFPFRVLKNIALGYGATFFVYGDRISNDFREGTWLSRMPYAYFICGGPAFLPTFLRSCEEAYTYTVVDSISPFQDLRASYRFAVASDPRGEEANNWWGQRVEIEAGVKYSVKKVTVRQGWDRYDRDEVFRRVQGRGEALLPWARLNLQFTDSVSVSFGLEGESTPLRFNGVRDIGAISGLSLRYSVGASF